MADAKITQLTALGAFASGDLIPMVDDPSGIPETKKATIDQVKDFVTQSANQFTANNYFTGNVGIGTTSPSSKLHVKDSSGDLYTRFEGANNVNISKVYISSTSSGDGGIQYDPNSNAMDVFSYGPLKFNVGTGNLAGSIANERMRITSAGYVGIGTTSPSTELHVIGTITGTVKNFTIPHPISELSKTHNLIHTSIEAPTADNIYRGKVSLVNGQASINIDSLFGMTGGTFPALNGNVQVFLQNDSGWDLVRGSVDGSVLSIVSQNNQSTDTISWLVIGERQDQHMLDTQWTDEFGRPILEQLRDPEPDVATSEDRK